MSETVIIRFTAHGEEALCDLENFSIEDFNGEWEEYPSATALLNAILPDAVDQHSEVVAKLEDGTLVEINMHDVLSVVPMAYEHPLEVVTYLTQIRQGICNMAYMLEEYYARQSDSFRVWRADWGRKLNRKDELNPLVKEGSKTTNGAIEAYMRSQPEYEDFKNKIAEIETSKNMLWTAKRSIDTAVDSIKGLIGGVLVDEEDAPPLVQKTLDESRTRLEDLAEQIIKKRDEESE